MRNTGVVFYCLVCLTVSAKCGEGAEVPYKKVTLDSILQSRKKSDGSRVELRGSIVSGFETNILRDPGGCTGANVRRCTAWLKLGHCVVVKSPRGETDCGRLIMRLAEEKRLRPTDTLVIEHVILRGKVSTIPKGFTYDKSVPASARQLGFGHLNAYPVEIEVEQLEMEAAQ